MKIQEQLFLNELKSLMNDDDGDCDGGDEDNYFSYSKVKVKVLSLNPCTSFSLFHLKKMEKVKKKFMGSIHISLSTISKTSTC